MSHGPRRTLDPLPPRRWAARRYRDRGRAYRDDRRGLGAVHAGREPQLTGPYKENDPFHEPLVTYAYPAGDRRLHHPRQRPRRVAGDRALRAPLVPGRQTGWGERGALCDGRDPRDGDRPLRTAVRDRLFQPARSAAPIPTTPCGGSGPTSERWSSRC